MPSFDYYYSFRSPYSYLAIRPITKLVETLDVEVNIRVVLPIAVRIPGFFKQVNPLWPPYLARDTYRIAEMTGTPYGWPRPDPIVMDISTGEVATEQPYIYRVSRMGTLAAEAGKGLAYLQEAAPVIWSGKQVDWHKDGHLEAAAMRAGLDAEALEAKAVSEADRLDAVITANEAAQKAAGHWGVPLFVFDGECFFGQDRIDMLEWRMRQKGVKER
jgi:2-hydroxychromene-2-carboxylate isomerase